MTFCRERIITVSKAYSWFHRNCGITTVTGVLGNTRYQYATDSSVFYINHTETPHYGGLMNGFRGVDVQFMTYDPCSPLLSVPSEVYKIDTAWSNCTAGISGLWDPPRVLLSASDPLAPDPTVTSQAEPTFISSAVPASIVTPNTPAATTSAGPSPKPPQVFSALSSSSDDPGSSSMSGNNRDSASKPQSGPSQDPSLLPEPRLSVDPGASVANNGGSGGSIQGDAELQGQYGSSSAVTRANLDPLVPVPSITTGSHTAIVLLSEDSSVNGATITADTAPITLDNSPTLIGSSYAIIGTSSLKLPIVPPNLPSSDGHPVEITSNGDVVVAGLTLSQGGSAITIAGTVVSLGADGLTVGISTTKSTSASILTLPLVGDQKVHIGANGDAVIAETTLLSGKPGIMDSGTLITLGFNGLIIGPSTYAVSAPSSDSTLPSIGGQQVQKAASGGVVIAGKTLLPGTPGMMISGISLSLDSAGLIVGSSIYALLMPTPAAIFTIGGETITAGTSSALLLAGQTISLGGPAVTMSGTIISIGSAGLLVGSKTYSIPAASHKTPPLITFGAQVYTVNSIGDFAAGSKSLVPGGAELTISGTPVSLAPSDEDIVVGGKTSSIDLGVLIMGGFGGGSATATSSALANSSIVAFTGQAPKRLDVQDRYTLFFSAVVVAGFGVLTFGL